MPAPMSAASMPAPMLAVSAAANMPRHTADSACGALVCRPLVGCLLLRCWAGYCKAWRCAACYRLLATMLMGLSESPASLGILRSGQV
eukprot:363042-Chlamydomonas_euryale.AAC.3